MNHRVHGRSSIPPTCCWSSGFLFLSFSGRGKEAWEVIFEWRRGGGKEKARLRPWESYADREKAFVAHARSCLALSVTPSKAFQAFLTGFVSVSVLSLNPVPLCPFALSREARSDSLQFPCRLCNESMHLRKTRGAKRKQSSPVWGRAMLLLS